MFVKKCQKTAGGFFIHTVHRTSAGDQLSAASADAVDNQ